MHRDRFNTKTNMAAVYMTGQLKNESFFLGSRGMNRSAGQTNRVNRKAVLERFTNLLPTKTLF